VGPAQANYPAALPAGAHGAPANGSAVGSQEIIFRIRSACQWNQLPREFGDDSIVHRWFQAFVKASVFEEIWAVLAAECERLGTLGWTWQAADG
jgi:transposase